MAQFCEINFFCFLVSTRISPPQAETYFPAGYKAFPGKINRYGRNGSPEIWQELMFVAARYKEDFFSASHTKKILSP
jgi:hypothetical protein